MGTAKGFAAGAALGIAAGAELVHLNNRFRENYVADLMSRIPEGGLEEPILPYLEQMLWVCEDENLDVVLMGGPVKQALLDPSTIIDPVKRQIRVNADPGHRVHKKGTLYRPEGTLRDADWFTRRILINGEWVTCGPEYKDELAERAERIQERSDWFALERGMKVGPKISLFGYEERKRGFKPTHYATTTELFGNEEVMSHSLGAEQSFPVTEDWEFIVEVPGHGTVTIPTCSPARLLGRTYTRSLVLRERDREEVEKAVANIGNMGLSEDVLGDEWLNYCMLRRDLNHSMRLGNVVRLSRRGNAAQAAGFLAAKLAAPLAPKIEESYIALMIRDPDSKIYPITERIMGASQKKKPAPAAA